MSVKDTRPTQLHASLVSFIGFQPPKLFAFAGTQNNQNCILKSDLDIYELQVVSKKCHLGLCVYIIVMSNHMLIVQERGEGKVSIAHTVHTFDPAFHFTIRTANVTHLQLPFQHRIPSSDSQLQTL